jgi:hypothetical protein
MESTMTRKSAVPEVPGIDLTFRPKSYFWSLGLDTHLLARIKGAERKAAVQKLIDAGGLDDIPSFLRQSALSAEERQAFGRIHPACMGGEYLPSLSRTEVEIARITIASTTQDVTSVYARRGKNRIYYRVVDEYEGQTMSEKTTRTSTRPLTLGELEKFFNGAWPIFGVLAHNFWRYGFVLEDMLAFTKVQSEFYPQIDDFYERRIEVWAEERRTALSLMQAKAALARAASPEPHE